MTENRDKGTEIGVATPFLLDIKERMTLIYSYNIPLDPIHSD